MLKFSKDIAREIRQKLRRGCYNFCDENGRAYPARIPAEPPIKGEPIWRFVQSFGYGDTHSITAIVTVNKDVTEPRGQTDGEITKEYEIIVRRIKLKPLLFASQRSYCTAHIM